MAVAFESAQVAIGRLRPGARVYAGSLAGTPLQLLEALAASGLPDIELVYFLAAGIDLAEFVRRAPGVRHRPLYLGQPLPRSLLGDSISVVPQSLPEAAHFVRTGRLVFDAALVATTWPDQADELSLGVSIGMTDAVLETTPLALAECVRAMPRVAGAPKYAAGRFAACIAADRALPEYAHPRDEAAAERIGRYLARLVEDGSTLQLGPGRVANGALRYVAERRELRLRSDVLYEEAGALAESGALAAGASVLAADYAGSRAWFEHVAADARYRIAGITEVAHAPALLATPRLVSITQAFAIDLSGQACCDSFGDALLGGLASQPEFMRAASRAPGGKSILCLYATDAQGRSAIRAQLSPGEPATLARSDVHFVITEYGIACLPGKSLQERALALIEVAAPDAREALLAEARDLGLVAREFRRANRDAYAVEDERTHVARDGRQAQIRPARLRDVAALQHLFHRLPADDIYLRFFRYLRSLSIDEAVRLCAASQPLDAMWVAVEGPPDAERVVASACLLAEPTTQLGEVGYLVDPGWQGAGLGRALQSAVVDKARALGLRGLSAQILAGNQKMLQLARASGLAIEMERDGDTYDLVMTFES